MRRNDLPRVVAVKLTGEQGTGRTRLNHRPCEGHRSTAPWNSAFLLVSFAPDAQAAAASVLVQWNSVPSAHMRCMITAIRRATATTARFIPRCRAIFMPQALSHDHLMVRVIMTWA